MQIATAGLAALAAGAVYAFGKFEESENVMQQTDAVLKSTGGAANVTAKQVARLADSLSEVSGVDDEVIASGENMLLTFKNIQNVAGQNNDIFNQATVATLDMAAGMAAASGGTIDMKASSIQLGKALNDPVLGMTALTRVGVQFSEQQQKQIENLVKHNDLLGAQKIILAEVTSQFAGSAEAQATTSGALRVSFENLAEVVGGLLAPAIRAIADGLTALIAFVQEKAVPAWDAFVEGLGKAWTAVQPFAEALGSILIPLLQTTWNTIQDRIIPVLERLKPLFIVIGAAVVLFAGLMIAQFALVVTAVGFVIDKFLDLVGFVRDKVVEPIVNFLGRVADKIEDVASWITDKFVGAWKAAAGPVLAVIGTIVNAIEKIVSAVQSAIGWIAKLGSGETPYFPSRGQPAATIPEGQSGGFVARSGMAIIHKGETLVPANAGMSGVTVVVNGWVGNDQAIARKVRDELIKLGKRNVTSGI